MLRKTISVCKLSQKLKTVIESLSDLTNASAGPEAGNSKLQSEMLEKMIHSRVMATVPDSGPRNVRVSARASIDELNKLQKRGFIDDWYDDVVDPEGAAEVTSEVDLDTEKDNSHQEIVDAQTVKKLSNLIVQREVPTRRKRTTKTFTDDGDD